MPSTQLVRPRRLPPEAQAVCAPQRPCGARGAHRYRILAPDAVSQNRCHRLAAASLSPHARLVLPSLSAVGWRCSCPGRMALAVALPLHAPSPADPLRQLPFTCRPTAYLPTCLQGRAAFPAGPAPLPVAPAACRHGAGHPRGGGRGGAACPGRGLRLRRLSAGMLAAPSPRLHRFCLRLDVAGFWCLHVRQLSRRVKGVPGPSCLERASGRPPLAVAGCCPLNPDAGTPAHPPALQAALDDALVRVRTTLAGSHDLAGQLKSAENAFRLYLKTRPSAAAESVKRAKALPKVG